jgi:short-subunit dehydrogenase
MFQKLFLCKKEKVTKNRFKYSFLEYLLFAPKRRFNNMNLDSFKGKTILITGSSYGIGESLARLLAQKETHLILVARTEAKLLELKSELESKGSNVTVFTCDFYEESAVDELIFKINESQLNIDVFINNAGKSIRRSVFESLDRYHDVSRLINVNYCAPVKLSLALISMLQKQHGQIINVSSLSVLLPAMPYWASYHASKSAFKQWFESVAPELEAQGIHTSSIYLPLVKTRMIEPTKKYKELPAMHAQHAAEWIVEALVQKRKSMKPWWTSVVCFFAFICAPFIRFFNRKNLRG